MKTIIVIRGSGNTGKTTAIKRVYALRPQTWQTVVYREPDKDIVATIQYHQKLIGISSFGDECKTQIEFVQNLIDANCEVILTASRSSGGRLTDLEALAAQHGYEVIWKLPNNKGNVNLSQMPHINDAYARALINLIEQLLK
jgi:hypothetical protein